MLFHLEPIGLIQSCFEERFGIPRQPRLATAAQGLLKLPDELRWRHAVRGLEGYSHVWLVVIFHANSSQSWNALVRPPRLGGEKKTGVFSSRSPHRPNAIGLSAVELLEVRAEAPGGAELVFAGIDLLDVTPVLDVKPYVPYSDSIPSARCGWAVAKPIRHPVRFAPEAMKVLQANPELKKLIRQVLSLDPRPAFQARKLKTSTEYAMKLAGHDVHWRAEHGKPFLVTRLTTLASAYGSRDDASPAKEQRSPLGRKKAGSSSRSRPSKNDRATRP